MAGKIAYGTETEEEKISKINAAGIINVTIENLWRDVFLSMAKGDLVTWNRKLDAVWGILGGDVAEGEKEDKAMEALNLQIIKQEV